MDNAFQTHDEIRRIFRLLRPQTANEFHKSRFGCVNDGGYILLDDFRGIDKAFSFGIAHNSSWDVDIADRGVKVYQFDHTVDAPITGNPRLIFSKKRISTATAQIPDGYESIVSADTEPNSETLSSLIKQHDRQESRPNILLKMDIEHSEWDILDTTPSDLLGRFTQIVGEFHYFQGLAELHWRQLYARVLKRVTDRYAVIHVHANNFASFSNIANVMVPNVLEITFANRQMYSFTETDELFPGTLDSPNDSSQPDMYLGDFRF